MHQVATAQPRTQSRAGIILAGIAGAIIVVLALTWNLTDGHEWFRDILKGPGAYRDPGLSSAPVEQGTPGGQTQAGVPDTSAWPAYQANHTQCLEQIRLEPGNPWRYLDLAMEYYWDGYRQEALAPLEVAVSLDPGFTEGHMQQGVIYMELNRQAEGLEKFRFCSQQADNFMTDLDIAEYLGAAEYDELALSYYDKALQHFPDNAGQHLVVARSSYAVGFPERSKQEYLKAMSLSSPGQEVYDNAKSEYEMNF